MSIFKRESIVDNIILGILYFWGVLVLLLIVLVWNQPNVKCTKGHYETGLVYNISLKMSLPVKRFVCDEELINP